VRDFDVEEDLGSSRLVSKLFQCVSEDRGIRFLERSNKKLVLKPAGLKHCGPLEHHTVKREFIIRELGNFDLSVHLIIETTATNGKCYY